MSVSAVIPAYNAEAFIARAIDSVLQQTQRDIEIIVVDDGSTDATVALVQGYGKRVRLISQGNGGPARARNTGVNNSSGEYLAFLDADDWWDPTKIEQQISNLQANPSAIASYTGLRLRYADGHTGVALACDPKELRSALRIGNPCVPPSCVVVTRKAFDEVGGFNVDRRGCEDWELWFRLCRIGLFVLVPDPVTNYVVSDTGLSGNADQMFSDFSRMLDSVLLRDLTGISRRAWRRKALSYQSFKAALTARGARQRDKEMAYMMRSIFLWPSPFWQPMRFRAFAVTMMRSLQSQVRQ
jgi:glycosyltransferase involved in cell wall biosynthesis